MLRKISYYGLLIGTVVFFALFFFYPVFQVLKGGLRDSEGKLTFFYLAEVFRNPIYLEGLLNSVKIAICSTLVAVLISLPLAWLSDRFEFAGKKYLTGALLLPMILAPFVGALGMQCIFGRYGAFNTLLEHLGLFGPGEGPDWFAGGFWGVVIMEALHLFPILYLNIVAAFANVDPMLLEASADLGCTGFRRFRKVMLPLIMPGVFAGGSLVFIWAFTELGTPLMFNFDRSTAVQIYSGINEIGSNPMPYALVLVMMVLSAMMYIIAKVCFGRNSYAMMSKAGRATSTVRLTGVKALPVILAFGAIGLFSLLPHLGVLGLAVCNSWMGSMERKSYTLEPAGHIFQTHIPIPVSERIGQFQKQRRNGNQSPVSDLKRQDDIITPLHGFTGQIAAYFQRCRGPEHSDQGTCVHKQEQHGKQQKKLTAGTQGDRQQHQKNSQGKNAFQLHNLTGTVVFCRMVSRNCSAGIPFIFASGERIIL